MSTSTSAFRRPYPLKPFASRRRGELRISRPSKLFISYAEPDRDYALDVAKALREAGVSVWFDEWELFPGDNWAAVAGSALAAADGLALVISRAALESTWIRRSVQYALGHERFEKRLFVVLIDKIPDDERPPWLRYVAPIDMVGRPRAEALSVVVDAVRHAPPAARTTERRIRRAR